MIKIKRRRFIKNTFLGLFGLLFIDSFWFEKLFVDWNYFDISNGSKEKIKLIHLSDLHINKIGHSLKSIAKKINTIKPDIICITGDSIDKSNNIGLLNEFLSLIDQSISKFAILGNWEYWSSVDLFKLEKVYNSNNCELLINKHKTIKIKNRYISISGLDDFLGGKPNLESTLKGKKNEGRNIILVHCPIFFKTINNSSLVKEKDLILSGHTHGGQINLFGFSPFKPVGTSNYLKGWYMGLKAKMYVSRGVGTSQLPIRFGSRSEVIVFTL